MLNLIGTHAHTNPIRYKSDQNDREVSESTLEAALRSGDIPELKSTQDIDKYAAIHFSGLAALMSADIARNL